MAKRAKKVVRVSGKDDNKILFAFLVAFLSIIGFVIALIVKRDDEYVMFYAKQSLVVFIFSVIIGILAKIFLFLPVIGIIINAAVGIVTFVLWLLSWIYALSGEEKEVPIVGRYARRFRF